MVGGIRYLDRHNDRDWDQGQKSESTQNLVAGLSTTILPI